MIGDSERCTWEQETSVKGKRERLQRRLVVLIIEESRPHLQHFGIRFESEAALECSLLSGVEAAGHYTHDLLGGKAEQFEKYITSLGGPVSTGTVLEE